MNKKKENNKLVSFSSSVLLNTFLEQTNKKEEKKSLTVFYESHKAKKFLFVFTFFCIHLDVPIRSANHDDLLFVICRKNFFPTR